MSENRRPNVVFVLTDDQRYGTIHALGNNEIKTPNLDRLVQNGTSFINAHIPGGTASAVCMPSRAMINSGKTLFHLEDCGKNIPADQVTMGQCFLQNGYHSMGTGKWHNGVDSFARSFDSGDNIFFGGMWDHWNVPVNNYQPSGKYEKEIMFTPNFSANEVPVAVRAEKISAGVHSTELFTNSAVEYVENYQDDKPFFMYLSFLAPHDPRTMPKEYRNMYNADDITLPPNFQEVPSFSFGWANKGRDENTEVYPRRPQAVKQHIADYYAMISHVDAYVGKLLDALERKGILDNTIIVFCGDNGLAIGQHGLMGKQNLYEHSVRIPLVMAGPGIPKNKVDSRYVYLLDIYPTLCELCGMEIPATVDGKSFAKLFTDDNAEIRPELYLAFQARIRGVMNKRFKLLEYRSEHLKLTQLFDLQEDPWEKNNLFDLPGYEGVTEHLRQRLMEMKDEWDDESILFGQQYWQQYRQYAEAVVPNVAGPKGVDMAKQIQDWGTNK